MAPGLRHDRPMSPRAPLLPRIAKVRLPLLLAGLVAALVLGAGVFYAVQAEWRPVPVVKPYDPLPSW